jgi:hypothetical protein
METMHDLAIGLQRNSGSRFRGSAQCFPNTWRALWRSILITKSPQLVFANRIVSAFSSFIPHELLHLLIHCFYHIARSAFSPKRSLHSFSVRILLPPNISAGADLFYFRNVPQILFKYSSTHNPPVLLG